MPYISEGQSEFKLSCWCKRMGHFFLLTIATVLEQVGINLNYFFQYYQEKSIKLSTTFYCRRNKYTNKKYFRTMRSICNGWDSNEWIEYGRKVDDIIT